MEDEELIYDLADLFKIFADSTRIRILFCLSEKESCVGDIAAALEMSQTAISHQLARAEAESPGALPPRRQADVLFAGGRPCENDSRRRT